MAKRKQKLKRYKQHIILVVVLNVHLVIFKDQMVQQRVSNAHLENSHMKTIHHVPDVQIAYLVNMVHLLLISTIV